MNIYIAASFTRKYEAQCLALVLEREHTVVSRWHLGENDADYGSKSESEIDWQDLKICDTVVCITGDTETRGGRHAEVGIGLAWHKQVILLGPRENVFHQMCLQVDTNSELIRCLSSM